MPGDVLQRHRTRHSTRTTKLARTPASPPRDQVTRRRAPLGTTARHEPASPCCARRAPPPATLPLRFQPDWRTRNRGVSRTNNDARRSADDGRAATTAELRQPLSGSNGPEGPNESPNVDIRQERAVEERPSSPSASLPTCAPRRRPLPRPRPTRTRERQPHSAARRLLPSGSKHREPKTDAAGKSSAGTRLTNRRGIDGPHSTRRSKGRSRRTTEFQRPSNRTSAALSRRDDARVAHAWQREDRSIGASRSSDNTPGGGAAVRKRCPVRAEARNERTKAVAMAARPRSDPHAPPTSSADDRHAAPKQRL